eukprot:TRINITY_DN74401_c0_g1_i1.p1 TRINITY_DN74401_c0_g1~~TRINITY_DN74401_c0_g1_i1.p1  ORF type:complete len:898 (+),score=100.06 TRINITY_DN74401_c0_g1_i1:107-2800(+)
MASVGDGEKVGSDVTAKSLLSGKRDAISAPVEAMSEGGSCGIPVAGAVSGDDTIIFQTTHSDCPCEVLHLAPEGRHLLSIGTDGRLLSTDLTTEAPTRRWASRVGEPNSELTAVAMSSDFSWLAFSQSHDCRVWVRPMDLNVGPGSSKILMAGRFTLPVRHLSWHSTEPLLGIATDDGRLVIWSCGERTVRREFVSKGVGGGVQCVAFDPCGDFLAAAFTGGELVVFRFKERSEHFRKVMWPKTIIGRERLVISWRPDGSALALPGAPSIKLLRRTSFSAPPLLLERGHNHATTLVAWSPVSNATGIGGDLLASISCDAVVIWRPPHLLRVVKPSAEPHSLAWAWGSNGAVNCAIGALKGAWALVSLGEADLQRQTESSCTSTQQSDAAAAKVAAETEFTGAKSDTLPRDLSFSQATTSDGRRVVATPKPCQLPVVEQDPFQPGSTVGYVGGGAPPRRRYLSWNDSGALKFFIGEEPPRSASTGKKAGQIGKSGTLGHVEVDYSRERGHSSVREIRALEGLTIGAVGPGVCALAADATKGLPARIVTHLTKPWERPSFEHILPEGEQALLLTVGRNFLATFTDSPLRLLRIHTLTGLSLGVIAFAGEPVCLVACEDLLLCVTEAPGPKVQEPVLEYKLYAVRAKECLASGRLPLSSQSTLRWVGFSAESLPLAVDSAGVLRALPLSCDGTPTLAVAAGEWLPVGNLDEPRSRLWPVRAEAGVLYCAEIPGGKLEPPVSSVQRLRGIRFRLPIGTALDGSERILRQRLFSGHSAFALEAGLLSPAAQRSARDAVGRQGRGTEQQQVLKLFESFAKAGLLQQAVDVIGAYLGIGDGSQEGRIRALEEARSMTAAFGDAVVDSSTLKARVDGLLTGDLRRSREEASGEDNSSPNSRRRLA